jgi:hypothetical protein
MTLNFGQLLLVLAVIAFLFILAAPLVGSRRT